MRRKIQGESKSVTLRLSPGMASRLNSYVAANMAVHASTAVQTMIFAFLSNPDEYPPLASDVQDSLTGNRRTSFSISSESYQRLAEIAEQNSTSVVALLRRIMYWTFEKTE